MVAAANTLGKARKPTNSAAAVARKAVLVFRMFIILLALYINGFLGLMLMFHIIDYLPSAQQFSRGKDGPEKRLISAELPRWNRALACSRIIWA
jgi:hypothetical protein